MIFPRKSASGAPHLGGAVIRAGAVGLHPLSGLIVGGGAGYFLWKQYDAAWCFWVLLLLGLVAGCRNAYRDVQRMLREEHEQKTTDEPPRR